MWQCSLSAWAIGRTIEVYPVCVDEQSRLRSVAHGLSTAAPCCQLHLAVQLFFSQAVYAPAAALQGAVVLDRSALQTRAGAPSPCRPMSGPATRQSISEPPSTCFHTSEQKMLQTDVLLDHVEHGGRDAHPHINVSGSRRHIGRQCCCHTRNAPALMPLCNLRLHLHQRHQCKSSCGCNADVVRRDKPMHASPHHFQTGQ